MNDFTIITDSACDIDSGTLKDWDVDYASLTFMFDGSDVQYNNDDMPAKTFYNNMREGKTVKTSAVNIDAFRQVFEKHFKLGKDILYLGFSSGLSTTFNSARLAAEDLAETYPDRKAVCVDTLAASAGQGLLVYLTVQQQRKGASLEETAAFAESTKLKICHWFTVDDLVYLKRGGRISPTVAFVGGVLGIKPVMHMDNDGHLTSSSKARGRKAAVKALADKYAELAATPSQGAVFISHSDCWDDAEALKEIIKSTYGVTVKIITDVGPVIGAHSGPGTLALFFVGRER